MESETERVVAEISGVRKKNGTRRRRGEKVELRFLKKEDRAREGGREKLHIIWKRSEEEFTKFQEGMKKRGWPPRHPPPGRPSARANGGGGEMREEKKRCV